MRTLEHGSKAVGHEGMFEVRLEHPVYSRTPVRNVTSYDIRTHDTNYLQYIHIYIHSYNYVCSMGLHNISPPRTVVDADCATTEGCQGHTQKSDGGSEMITNQPRGSPTPRNEAICRGVPEGCGVVGAG